MHLELESLRTGYAEMGAYLLEHGEEVSPRGTNTREVLGFSFSLQDPTDSLPVGTGRGVVKALAASEALQLIGGFHDPSMLVAVAPHFANFLGEDGRQRAPYGPRLADQIPTAVEHLTEDPDTRQAQVVIWTPNLDNFIGLHDYPCTTSLQWLIRRDRLDMQVHMRSNDFWLGVPYDVFAFTQTQLTIAAILGIEPGIYRHSAASMHVYERDWEKAGDLTAPETAALPTYGVRASDWYEAAERARAIHDDQEIADMSAGEQWLHLALAAAHGGG